MRLVEDVPTTRGEKRSTYTAFGGQHHDVIGSPTGCVMDIQTPPTTPAALLLVRSLTKNRQVFPLLDGHLPHPFTLQSLVAPGVMCSTSIVKLDIFAVIKVRVE